MGFYIKYDDIRSLMNTTNGQFTTWNDEMKAITGDIQRVLNMNTFQGNTANSVKSYFSEVHNLLLASIGEVIADFSSKALIYSHGYYEIDSDMHAKISEEILDNTKRRYNDSKGKLETEAERLGSKLNEISDILYIPTPRNTSIIDNYENVEYNVQSLKDKITEYENNKLSTDLANLENLIAAVKASINDFRQGGNCGMAGYKPGDLRRSAHIMDLGKQIQISIDYCKQNENEVKAAIENENQVQQKLAEEAMSEARKDQGIAQMIIAGVIIVAAGVTIVATFGAATPIVGPAAVAATTTLVVGQTCTVAYGVSTGIEGYNNYKYGSIGDPYTSAFNPIRDTVFCGNQKMYDLWGTASSLMVPGGTAALGAKTAGTSITKAVVTEVGKEVVLDYATGKTIDFVGDKYNISESVKVAMNLGLGAGVGWKMNKTKTQDGVNIQDNVNTQNKVNIENGDTQANLGNLNGKTPAARVADKFRGLPANKRPNTVAVIRTKDGEYIIGRNSGGVVNDKVQESLEIVGINEFEGQCAEVNALARAMNKGIDLDGATISVSNVRGINSTNGVHGTFKKPCSTCEPLLEYFKIPVNKGDK